MPVLIQFFAMCRAKVFVKNSVPNEKYVIYLKDKQSVLFFHEQEYHKAELLNLKIHRGISNNKKMDFQVKNLLFFSLQDQYFSYQIILYLRYPARLIQ